MINKKLTNKLDQHLALECLVALVMICFWFLIFPTLVFGFLLWTCDEDLFKVSNFLIFNAGLCVVFFVAVRYADHKFRTLNASSEVLKVPSSNPDLMPKSDVKSDGIHVDNQQLVSQRVEPVPNSDVSTCRVCSENITHLLLFSGAATLYVGLWVIGLAEVGTLFWNYDPWDYRVLILVFIVLTILTSPPWWRCINSIRR